MTKKLIAVTLVGLALAAGTAQARADDDAGAALFGLAVGSMLTTGWGAAWVAPPPRVVVRPYGYGGYNRYGENRYRDYGRWAWRHHRWHRREERREHRARHWRDERHAFRHGRGWDDD